MQIVKNALPAMLAVFILAATPVAADSGGDAGPCDGMEGDLCYVVPFGNGSISACLDLPSYGDPGTGGCGGEITQVTYGANGQGGYNTIRPYCTDISKECEPPGS